MGSWRGSMLAALVATLGRPAWWSMALAAFLVRGGILVILLPIVVLPTPAALANLFSPAIQDLALGGLTTDRLLLAAAVAVALFLVIGAAGLAGAFLDVAQLREAAEDEELDLRWQPAQASVAEALALRLTAHLPTVALAVYASARLVQAGYDELVAPGDVATPIPLRIALRAPEAVVLPVLAWIAGEVVGGLAARRSAAGVGVVESLWRSTRQLVTARGLGTLVVTNGVVAAVLASFLLGAGRSWEHLQAAILEGTEPIQAAAALLVFVGTWMLALAVLGAALAFRSAAWTAEVAPVPRTATSPSAVTRPPPQASEPSR